MPNIADEYHPDGADRLMTLMKDTFGDQFNYFNGEYITFGNSDLPAIIVTETTAIVTTGAAGFDQITETIAIVIALNMLDDSGAQENTKLTEYKIRKLIMGQDPTTREFMPRTVMYALRRYYTNNSDTLTSDVEIDFYPSQRGDKEVIPTMEGYVKVNMGRIINVPVRS